MLIYLLKSGVCLAVFYGFYKFLLEKESIHTFKRYYLLASVVLAFIIPFITFTEYIKATPQNVPSLYSDVPLTNTIIEVEPINYASIILWTIYGLGVLLFSIKFFKNLSQLLYKIKHNTKVKVNQITNVLLQDLIVPHTFFNYIFLNKQKFETQQIPKEVLLHEETHAKQKHSLDVLFIEILQILFWFNPFIYFIKKDIKLNHEFLADQAVLKQGIASSTYQNILLAFSSNASYSPLANAIHYSSIKKRFTVMNTHTSKKAFWLRSLIILPLLALLIYGFSTRKVIEKPQGLQTINGEIKVVINKDRKVIVVITTDRNVIINNELIDFNSLSDKLIKLTMNEKIKPVLYIEIQGHLNTKYLEEIKNELGKTNLKISTIQANSMFLDENNYEKGTRDYFKGVPFTGDTLAIMNEKSELMFGISSPNQLTSEDVNIIKKGFTEKYKIKQKIGKEPYIITGIKESSNANPFSLTMNNDSPQNIKKNEGYDSITIKLPRNRGRYLNSNDLEKLDEFVKETFYEKDKK